eukprot:484964_1
MAMDVRWGFMLFWSLSSGFGILFAILSWIYDLYELSGDPFFTGFKGVLALGGGLFIGGVHAKISGNNNNVSNYLESPKGPTKPKKTKRRKRRKRTTNPATNESQNLKYTGTINNANGAIVHGESNAYD